MNRNTGEIKEQTVFMGDFPMMTEKGTFIINGTERVVVSQLVRSPGVIFEPGERFRLRNLTKHQLVKGTIHPYRGEWMEFDVEQKPGKDVTAGTRVARKRRLGIFTLLRALGYDEENAPGFLDRFVAHFDFLEGQWEKERDIAPTQDEALVEIYKRARPGEPPTVESARAYFRNAFFENRRYDLSRGRPLQAQPQARRRGRQARRAVRPRPTSQLEPLPDAEDQNVLSRVRGRSPPSRYMLHLVKQEPGYRLDDQDHFANRRIRSVGELIQNQVRIGLSPHGARRPRAHDHPGRRGDHAADADQHPPGRRRDQGVLRHSASCRSSWTRSTRCRASPTAAACRRSARAACPVSAPASRSATCTSATTAGCARSRRRRARTSASSVRLSTFARVNEFGFIETPVPQGRATARSPARSSTWPPTRRRTTSSPRPTRRSTPTARSTTSACSCAARPRRPASTTCARCSRRRASSAPPPTSATCRRRRSTTWTSSPKQIVSVGTALIPFLEHDDANRALMGANMQKQAVPLVRAEAPYIGTGIEDRAARDAADLIQALEDGEVTEVTGDIDHRPVQDARQARSTRLAKFRRSNQDTCINQRPRVVEGDKVRQGHDHRRRPVDRPRRAGARQEPARRVHAVGGLQLRGRHHPQSERLVKDDVLTSIHIHEHEVDARDTKLGPEEITRDIPNLSDDILADLDDRGIIRVGAEVGPGDVLVGKVTPEGRDRADARGAPAARDLR